MRRFFAMMPPMWRFDCQDCGACCCNTKKNRTDGIVDYIEVTGQDRLYLEDRPLLKKIGTRNDHGQWHLNLVGEEQRCVALEGDVGEGVACTIYQFRPAGCRQVESGDEECLKARRFFGFSVLPPEREGD
jgi:Fe-S-cluster containining protein